MRGRMAALAVATVMALGVPGAASATDPTGFYEVEGTLPSADVTKERGEVYTGTVQITPRGDVFDVFWKLKVKGAALERKGVALPIGDTIAIAYDGDDGVATSMALLMRPDGVYTGRWAAVDGQRLGFEFWKYAGPKTLEEAEAAAAGAATEK